MILGNSIFKQHCYFKTILLIRSPKFLCFVSESPNLTRIQTHQLCIGHVTLIKCKYLRLNDEEKETERNNGFAKFIAMHFSSFTCIS